MSQRLKDDLQAAVERGGKSMNDEIVKRLERSFGPDEALLQLAEVLRPFLASLSESEQATLITAARILARSRRKGPPRASDKTSL
jgi:hypothetical protein